MKWGYGAMDDVKTGVVAGILKTDQVLKVVDRIARYSAVSREPEATRISMILPGSRTMSCLTMSVGDQAHPSDTVSGRKTILKMKGEGGARVIRQLLGEFGGYFKDSREAPFEKIEAAVASGGAGTVLKDALVGIVPEDAAAALVAALEADPSALDRLLDAVEDYRAAAAPAAPRA